MLDNWHRSHERGNNLFNYFFGQRFKKIMLDIIPTWKTLVIVERDKNVEITVYFSQSTKQLRIIDNLGSYI